MCSIRCRKHKRLDPFWLVFLLQLLHRPAAQTRHRRQGDEGAQPAQLVPQVFHHLLDQKIAERDAAQARVAVRDRIEHGGLRIVRIHPLALRREDRVDRVRQLHRKRDLDEDQRLVLDRRVEEAVEPPVRRADAAAQIVPARDLMHRLVRDDVLERLGRGRPVDAAQLQKTAVEPGAEQVLEIAVEVEQFGLGYSRIQQITPHRDERGGAARRAVQAPDQLLGLRLGCEMQFPAEPLRVPWQNARAPFESAAGRR